MATTKSKEVFKVEVNGDTLELAVIEPTVAIKNEASLQYSKAFSQFFKAGAIIAMELDGELRKRNAWDDAKQAEYEKIQDEIRDGELKLKKGGIKKSEAKELSLKMIGLRSRLVKLRSAFDGLYKETAEALAENVRYNYLVYACTVYNSDRRRYFKSFDEYLEDSEGDVSNQAAEAMFKLQNPNVRNTAMDLPEYQFLVGHGFMDKEMRLIDKAGNFVDETGRRIDAQGFYVDESGNRTDFNGNPVDASGEYLVETAPFLDDEQEEGSTNNDNTTTSLHNEEAVTLPEVLVAS